MRDGDERDELPGTEPRLDDDHGVVGALLPRWSAVAFRSEDTKVVLDAGHHLALRPHHPREGKGVGRALVAVVLLDGVAAEVLDLLVGLHVPHLRPAPHHPPSATVRRQGGHGGEAEVEQEEER